MSQSAKLGRNDVCACGSGKKFKQCCALKGTRSSSWTSGLLLAAVAAAILGGVAAGVMSFGEAASAGPAPGKVWSPEHGHYH